jgi:ATP-dependent DNA ligase
LGACWLFLKDLIQPSRQAAATFPRKATLAGLLRSNKRSGISLSEHIEGDGPTIFRHACKLGCEGVSKRLGSRYRSGKSPDWIKSKNPQSPAVRREAEEDWRT